MNDRPQKNRPDERPGTDRRERVESPPYPEPVCEVCETPMYGLHCKIVCPNCGYKRDCSDP